MQINFDSKTPVYTANANYTTAIQVGWKYRDGIAIQSQFVYAQLRSFIFILGLFDYVNAIYENTCLNVRNMRSLPERECLPY